MTVSQIRLRAALAALLLLLSAVTAYAFRPTKLLGDQEAKVDLETLFPKQFGDWRIDDRGPVQVVSPDTQAALNEIYGQTLSRAYVNSNGDRIMLSVAYGGDQSDATRAHRPEVCYPAQGFEIRSSETGSIVASSQPLRVRRLVAALNARVEPITYWMTVGDRVALTGTEQKWMQLGYGMKGLIPDGMLVRVSSISNEKAKAYSTQDRFINDMASSIRPDFRPRIIGVAGT